MTSLPSSAASLVQQRTAIAETRSDPSHPPLQQTCVVDEPHAIRCSPGRQSFSPALFHERAKFDAATRIVGSSVEPATRPERLDESSAIGYSDSVVISSRLEEGSLEAVGQIDNELS